MKSSLSRAPRSKNERAILSLIRQQQSMPKAQIAKALALSAQAATVNINKLEEDKLLLRDAPIKGRVGQPSVPFRLNPDGAFSFGLKIGRRRFDLILVDLQSTQRASVSVEVNEASVDELKSFLETHIPQLISQLEPELRSQVCGLGVAMPFDIWQWQAASDSATNTLSQWQSFDLKGYLESQFNLSVYISNDNNAACCAELSLGNPSNYSDFLYVYLGAFLGGAVVINHQLLEGKSGNAGAIGSMLNADREQLLSQCSLLSLQSEFDKQQLGISVYELTDSQFSDHKLLVQPWLEKAAGAISIAMHNSLSLLDMQAVIIDSPLPRKALEQLKQLSIAAFARLDSRGLRSCEVGLGVCGEKAQSIGSAQLALSHHYF
ncbi:ROK family transcriptional regulator [Pseudoalteromonas sp. 2CM39R]|uniref:ROK family transcriptional regulator n=1 Tax=Pseudoalteromonas sp. 2CM39R TaxID=2929856 RepID=UPI0020BFBF82|nr:ROK family transcriptional regulator [Pseudoalteromonas sp. 2CM39R]MCK8125950.1 ROK family transcriptional regulator [Pseudoalteromonas sp. 2CM39R]